MIITKAMDSFLRSATRRGVSVLCLRTRVCCIAAIEEEKLAHLIVIGGTQVAWQGQPLLKAAEPSAFFEWRRQDALMNAVPGEFSVTALFEELTGGSRSPYSGVDHDSSHHSSSPSGPSPYAEKR